MERYYRVPKPPYCRNVASPKSFGSKYTQERYYRPQLSGTTACQERYYRIYGVDSTLSCSLLYPFMA